MNLPNFSQAKNPRELIAMLKKIKKKIDSGEISLEDVRIMAVNGSGNGKALEVDKLLKLMDELSESSLNELETHYDGGFEKSQEEIIEEIKIPPKLIKYGKRVQEYIEKLDELESHKKILKSKIAIEKDKFWLEAEVVIPITKKHNCSVNFSKNIILIKGKNNENLF